MKFEKIINKYKTQWIILGIMVVVYGITCLYVDITYTVDGGLSLLDSLYKNGNLTSYAYESSLYIPCHIVFSIWMFPLWLFRVISKSAVSKIAFLLWAKVLLAVLSGLFCYCFYINNKDRYRDMDFWVITLFSSVLFFLPVFYLGCYDVIELIAAYIGICLYIKEDVTSIKSLLILSVAIAIKGLFLFPIVIIVLLKEKRLVYIIRDGLIICIVPLLIKVVFSFLETKNTILIKNGEVATFDGSFIDRLFSSLIPGGVENISLFWLGFMILCGLAYWDDMFFKSGEKREKADYLMVCYFFLFISTVFIHPFWTIIMIPFVIQLIGNSNKNKMNVVLLLALEISMMGVFILVFDWVFLKNGTFSYLVLKNMSARNIFSFNVKSVAAVFNKFGYRLLAQKVFMAIQTACCILVLVVNYPNKETKLNQMEFTQDEKKKFVNIRIGIIICFLIVDFLINYCI